jgi:hypothetical protein
VRSRREGDEEAAQVATGGGERTSVGRRVEGGEATGKGPTQTNGRSEETHRVQGGEVASEGPARAKGSTTELCVVSFQEKRRPADLEKGLTERVFFLQSLHIFSRSRTMNIQRPPFAICTVAPRYVAYHIRTAHFTRKTAGLKFDGNQIKILISDHQQI